MECRNPNTLSLIELRLFVSGLAGSDRPDLALFASSDPGGLESTALELGGPPDRPRLEPQRFSNQPSDSEV